MTRSLPALAACTFSFTFVLAVPTAARAADNVPPEGFTALFSGRDLAGWYGWGTRDPAELRAMSAEDRAAYKRSSIEGGLLDAKGVDKKEHLLAHWRVENGELVNDGQGLYATTDRDYGDFEFLLDWRLPEPCVDSGVYLRGIPQVQIWDPACERDLKHGCEKGSGGLWNNPAASPEHAPARFPLVKADKPVGEWNTMKITMRGEKVSVVLNGKTVVDDQPMANLFHRGEPLPEKGPIQIQVHGAPIHVRNLFIRELPAAPR